MSRLGAEGLDIRGWQPKPYSEDDALRSDRIITLGCALPTAKSIVMRKRQEWNDVPSPSEDYQNANHAIAERVALLVRELAQVGPTVIRRKLTEIEQQIDRSEP